MEFLKAVLGADLYGKMEAAITLIATRRGKDLTPFIDTFEFQKIITISGATRYYAHKYPQLFE